MRSWVQGMKVDERCFKTKTPVQQLRSDVMVLFSNPLFEELDNDTKGMMVDDLLNEYAKFNPLTDDELGFVFWDISHRNVKTRN